MCEFFYVIDPRGKTFLFISNHGINSIKLFTPPIYILGQKVGIFVGVRHFYLSLIFTDRTRAHPKQGPGLQANFMPGKKCLTSANTPAYYIKAQLATVKYL